MKDCGDLKLTKSSHTDDINVIRVENFPNDLSYEDLKPYKTFMDNYLEDAKYYLYPWNGTVIIGQYVRNYRTSQKDGVYRFKDIWIYDPEDKYYVSESYSGLNISNVFYELPDIVKSMSDDQINEYVNLYFSEFMI